jgi:hypothetical protein
MEGKSIMQKSRTWSFGSEQNTEICLKKSYLLTSGLREDMRKFQYVYYEERVKSEGISYSIQNISHMLHPHNVS